jgi:hypothetical protein
MNFLKLNYKQAFAKNMTLKAKKQAKKHLIKILALIIIN